MIPERDRLRFGRFREAGRFLALVLALALALPVVLGGCFEKADLVWPEKKPLAVQKAPAGEQAPTKEQASAGERASAKAAESRQPRKPRGPLYYVHSWRADDSLLFLALFYAQDEAAKGKIEVANPWLSFDSRMQPGTEVWIPERILLPRLRRSLTLRARPEPEQTKSLQGRGRVGEVDLGSADPVKKLAPKYTSRIKIHQHHKVSAKRPLK